MTMKETPKQRKAIATGLRELAQCKRFRQAERREFERMAVRWERTLPGRATMTPPGKK